MWERPQASECLSRRFPPPGIAPATAESLRGIIALSHSAPPPRCIGQHTAEAHAGRDHTIDLSERDAPAWYVPFDIRPERLHASTALVVRLFHLLPAFRRGEHASRVAARCHSGDPLNAPHH